MKKFQMIASLTACLVCASSAVPFAAFAEDMTDYVYGTMDIPYAEFYKAEFADSSNAFELDAVSSATTSKWAQNGAGETFEGTYHSEANADGSGSILGVTYPVAIKQADLDALTDKHNFTPVEDTPEAYKIVTVTDGTAEFSAIQDANQETFDTSVALNTSAVWGDYVLTPSSLPEGLGAVYGAILKTQEGDSYVLRHEQNIYKKGQLAWSSGITKEEPHGNALEYENYVSLMGQTITEIVYIGKDGYYTTATDIYVPIKFEGSLSVENGRFGKAVKGTGVVNWTKNNFPDDYAADYAIADNFAVDEKTGLVSYKDALPGSYTLTASDNNQKYADVSTSFILSTSALPVTANEEKNKIITAPDFTDPDAANFIKNISKVTVNGKAYSATGKGAVKIVGADGVIDFNAKSKNENVFDGSGNYAIKVEAIGYETALVITIGEPAEIPDDEELIYGTMEIPYVEFYRYEIPDNFYEIDAVSSATTVKWAKNTRGDLFEGTYNQANDDGTGTILGVVYPVGITQAELDALTTDNYNFKPLSEVPAAYKKVTITEDGSVEFSGVVAETLDPLESNAYLSTESDYGDYQINLDTFVIDVPVYGVVLNTTNGNFALRHEQNIWKNGELAWSVGLTKTEENGNELDVENYDQIPGSTITSIQYITKDGYLTVETDLYVPIKFEHEFSVDDGASGSGSVNWVHEGFPADYDIQYTITDRFDTEGLNDKFTLDEFVTYTDVLPGTYTLTATDGNGKYATLKDEFTLSTSDIPATYDLESGSLVPAEGFTQEEFDNFIRNLTSVRVNDVTYNATDANGKTPVKIVGDDGVIDFDAVTAAGKNIFDGSGNYKMRFIADGYDKILQVTLSTTTEGTPYQVDSPQVVNPGKNNNVVTPQDPYNKPVDPNNPTVEDPSPKTGESNAAAGILAALSGAGLIAFFTKKKKK